MSELEEPNWYTLVEIRDLLREIRDQLHEVHRRTVYNLRAPTDSVEAYAAPTESESSKRIHLGRVATPPVDHLPEPHEHRWAYAGQTLSHGGKMGTGVLGMERCAVCGETRVIR